MRYGKSAAQEIDPTVRRPANAKLKSAAPGAPFGWKSDGTPYIGTQYCIKQKGSNGFQFASLSTRDGGARYFWKDLSGVSAKVALSAIETHGCVEAILAGESTLRIGSVLEPSALRAVRAAFVRLLGKEALERLESVSDPEDDDDAETGGTAAADPAKMATQEKSTPAAAPNASSGAVCEEQSKVCGKKRVARMAMVDEIKKVPRTID